MPRLGVYAELLDASAEPARTALLVIRDQLALREEGRQFLESIAAHRLRSERTAEWPGTRLRGRLATVHHYRHSAELATRLRAPVRGLAGWRQRALPEDLCLLRGDGSEWLTTIAHEEWACLALSEEKHGVLGREHPRLAALLRPARGPRVTG